MPALLSELEVVTSPSCGHRGSSLLGRSSRLLSGIACVPGWILHSLLNLFFSFLFKCLFLFERAGGVAEREEDRIRSRLCEGRMGGQVLDDVRDWTFLLVELSFP